MNINIPVYSVWDPGFEACIQQRKTTCLLSIRISLVCARASELTTTNINIPVLMLIFPLNHNFLSRYFMKGRHTSPEVSMHLHNKYMTTAVLRCLANQLTYIRYSPVDTPGNDNVSITIKDVTTSFWRNNDVILPCVWWVSTKLARLTH